MKRCTAMDNIACSAPTRCLWAIYFYQQKITSIVTYSQQGS